MNLGPFIAGVVLMTVGLLVGFGRLRKGRIALGWVVIVAGLLSGSGLLYVGLHEIAFSSWPRQYGLLPLVLGIGVFVVGLARSLDREHPAR